MGDTVGKKRKPISLSLKLGDGGGPKKAKKSIAPPKLEAAAVEEKRDFVRSIEEGSQLQSTDPTATFGPKVIPLTVNPWQQQQQPPPPPPKSAPPPVQTSSEVVPEAEAPAPSADTLAAEALLKEVSGEDTEGDKGPAKVIALTATANGGAAVGPILQANAMPGLNEIDNEDDRFKYDLSMRADDVNEKSACYESMPIADFGAALMRGMGWTGHDESKDKGPGQVEPRHHRLGLGATPRPPSPKDSSGKRRIRKPGQKDKADLTAEWQKQAEAKVSKQKLRNGDGVWLRDVRFATKRAKVTRASGVPGLNKIEVQLVDSGEKVLVNRSDAVLEDVEDAQVDAAPREDHRGHAARGRDRDKDRDRDRDRDRRHNPSPPPPSCWVVPGIRVRVITRGADYRQKGTVLRVSGRERPTATVELEQNGRVAERLAPDELETVVPSVGGRVLVVRGKYTSRRARLVDKDRDREEARVEFKDGKQRAVSLDDVAEWMGTRK